MGPIKLTDRDRQLKEQELLDSGVEGVDLGEDLTNIRATVGQMPTLPVAPIEAPAPVSPAAPTSSLEDYKALLEEAKQRQMGKNLVANLGQIGTEYTSRMAGYKPDVSLYEGMRKQAGEDVTGAEAGIKRAEENAAKLERAKELIALRQTQVTPKESKTYEIIQEVNGKPHKILKSFDSSGKPLPDKDLGIDYGFQANLGVKQQGINIREQGLDLQKGKAEMVGQKAVDVISGAQELNENLKNIEKFADEAAAKDIGTGWWTTQGRDIGKKYLGINQDPTWINLQSSTGKALSSYMKVMSGTAVNESEVQRLSNSFPTTADNPIDLVSKIKLWKEDADRTLNNHLEAQQMAGKNVDEFIRGLKAQGINITVEPKGGKFTGTQQSPTSATTNAPTAVYNIGGKEYRVGDVIRLKDGRQGVVTEGGKLKLNQ